MNFTRLLPLAVLCMSASGAHAEDEWTDSRVSFICRSASEIREIKTYIFTPSDRTSPEALSCRVDYIKNGKTETIWSSRSNNSFCDGKAAALATKLAAENFTCKPLHAQKGADEPASQ